MILIRLYTTDTAITLLESRKVTILQVNTILINYGIYKQNLIIIHPL